MSVAPRPRFLWRLRTRTLPLGERTLLMGILNLTPDSFSDGGLFVSPSAALDHALRMLDSGADLLDLGGESTRPSSTPISPAEEQARVLPVLRSILAARPNAILSIDTYHAETAHAAIEAGAEIVNDVSGHLWDPEMSVACAALACGNVLMHTRGRPSDWRIQSPLPFTEVLPCVLRDLSARTQSALAAGIARDTIVLDPGFGFGKIMDENLSLLARFADLHALGYPLLAGLSRKSFLTHSSVGTQIQGRVPHSSGDVSRAMGGIEREQSAADTSPGASQPALSLPKGLGSETWKTQRDHATSAAHMAAILAGAHILRVHDVPAARTTAALADRLLAAGD